MTAFLSGVKLTEATAHLKPVERIVDHLKAQRLVEGNFIALIPNSEGSDVSGAVDFRSTDVRGRSRFQVVCVRPTGFDFAGSPLYRVWKDGRSEADAVAVTYHQLESMLRSVADRFFRRSFLPLPVLQGSDSTEA